MRRALAAAAILALALAGRAAAAPRIVSLDQCGDQFALALAPRDEIVGLSKRALNADSAERALAVGLPQIRPSLEAVLGARATVAVYAWTPDPRLPDALRRWGVTPVAIDEASDFAGVRADIRKVAAALGRPAAGEALIARMDAELRQAHGAWGGASALYLTPGGFTAGRGTLVGAMMAGAGLEAVAGGANGFAPISLESLVMHPPRALVLGFFRDLEAGREHWTIAGNGWLRALAARRTIASLPGSQLDCPDWTAADGALALAQAHHPPPR
jgi:iron complex transport system substrate-binding protein